MSPATGGQETSADEVLVSVEGPVLSVRLNRSQSRNALTPAMHHRMQAVFDDYASNPNLKVCILSASGPDFCAGSDLKAARERHERGEGKLELPASGYGGLTQRFDLTKPIIAAVQGRALAGGFEIALACDMIVAGKSARFALTEPHWGKVAIGGGPQRLVRAIGEKRAMELVLTSRLIPADEGLALGFLNRVVADAELDEAARSLALSLLRGGPLALRASKQLVARALDYTTLAAAIGDQEGLPAMQAWRASEEGSEGAAAFAEKRQPGWILR